MKTKIELEKFLQYLKEEKGVSDYHFEIILEKAYAVLVDIIAGKITREILDMFYKGLAFKSNIYGFRNQCIRKYKGSGRLCRLTKKNPLKAKRILKLIKITNKYENRN